MRMRAVVPQTDTTTACRTQGEKLCLPAVCVGDRLVVRRLHLHRDEPVVVGTIIIVDARPYFDDKNCSFYVMFLFGGD